MRQSKIKRVAALVVLIAVASLVVFGRVNNDPGQWVGALTLRVPIKKN